MPNAVASQSKHSASPPPSLGRPNLLRPGVRAIELACVVLPDLVDEPHELHGLVVLRHVAHALEGRARCQHHVLRASEVAVPLGEPRHLRSNHGTRGRHEETIQIRMSSGNNKKEKDKARQRPFTPLLRFEINDSHPRPRNETHQHRAHVCTYGKPSIVRITRPNLILVSFFSSPGSWYPRHSYSIASSFSTRRELELKHHRYKSRKHNPKTPSLSATRLTGST